MPKEATFELICFPREGNLPSILFLGEYFIETKFQRYNNTTVAGVSILMSYGVNPHYVELPIFSEFMDKSAKFMKNSGLTKSTQNLR